MNGTLFDVAVEAGPRPLLTLTNRFNLLEFLSSGLIVPRAGISKYYADLLEHGPGWIPFFKGPISTSLLEAVSREDYAFPVALEIDGVGTSLRGRALLTTGETVQDVPGGGDAIAWGVSGVVPMSFVRAIHFRSASDLEEHEARAYENVQKGAIPLRVTPELFGPGHQDAAVVEDWLRSLPAEIKLTADQFRRVDRVSGALALLAVVTPGERGQLESYAELVARCVPRPPKQGGTRSLLPPWMTASSLRLSDSAPLARSVGLEERLFRAVARVLINADRATDFRPLTVLAAVQATADAGASKKDQAELKRNLDPIVAILRNERDFRPFRPGVGLDVAKALLMVLSRPDPRRLISWSREETGADLVTEQTAAVFAGLLNGHKRLATELRSANLETVLGLRAAQELNEAAGSGDEAVNLTMTVQEGEDEALGPVVELKRDGVTVLVKQKRGRNVSERIRALDLDVAEQASAAVEVCRLLGWADCVESRVTIPTGRFTVELDPKNGVTQIIAETLATVRHEIARDRFAARLSADVIPDALEEKATELLP